MQYALAEVFVGYDLSDSAVKLAQELADAAGLSQLHYRVVDLDHEDLPHNSVDVAFAHQSFHHVTNLERLCDQIDRALRPGDLFHLNEFIGPTRFQWTHAQMAAINEFVDSMPERYRRQNNGELRQPITRPTIQEMIAYDPSKAVRSSEIPTVLVKYFDIVERHDNGGTLLHMGLQNIIQNFDPVNSIDCNWLKRFFALEDRLIADGTITSDFAVFTVTKRRLHQNKTFVMSQALNGKSRHNMMPGIKKCGC